MKLEEITRLKKWIARIGAAFCILFILCGIDGGVAYLREPLNSFKLLPGESTGLTGPMAPGATAPDHMTYESTSDYLSISIVEVISGFWMGGKMWRGTLGLDPRIEPGQYAIVVFGTGDGQKVGSNVFRIIVYKDRQSLMADSKSLLLRHTGISAWILSAAFFGLVLVCCGGLFLISGRIDSLMAEVGEAEVYHVTKDEFGLCIYFGLGERNGLEKGAKLFLMDSKRRPVEEITVESVSETDALARIQSTGGVKPGYFVKRV
jgi:hypothetical protein